jgi:predicted MFS family arabinose efflux permease
MHGSENCDHITVDQPRSLFAAVCFSAVAIIVFNALPVIMGVASDTLGLAADQIGLLASVELGGIGLASVSGLFWIRKLHWRRTVLIGTLVLATGNVLSIFADSATTLFVLRFLTGLLGEGVIFTVAIAAIGDARDTDRAFAFSIVGQVGLGMLALFSFPYIAHSMGYAGVMGIMAILAVACLVLLPWLPVGGAKEAETNGLAQLDASANSITTPLIGLSGMACWFVGLSGIWAFVERIGIEVPMTQTAVGTLLSLGLGLGAVASLVVALIGDRYGRFWPPLAAVALHVLICFLFAGKLNVIIYAVLVLSFTFVWNSGLPFLLGLIADSDSSGKMVVLIVSTQAFANTAGPLIAGQTIQLGGLASVGLFSGFFSLLALAIFAIFIYRVKSLLALKPRVFGTSVER